MERCGVLRRISLEETRPTLRSAWTATLTRPTFMNRVGKCNPEWELLLLRNSNILNSLSESSSLVDAAGSRFSTASATREQAAGLCWWMASMLQKSSGSSRPKTLSFCPACPSNMSTWRKLEPTGTTWWALALCSASTLGTTSFTRSGASSLDPKHVALSQAVK